MSSPVPTPPDGSPDQPSPRRAPSLQWRLPLLMSGVLAVILVAVLAVTYATLTQAAMAAAEDRLRSAVRQLALAAENGVRQGRGRYREVAHESEV